jgi:hypothetical protein
MAKFNLQTIINKNGDIFEVPDNPLDIINMTESTKHRVNGKRKGNNYERSVANDLSKRFKDTFRRVPQSGAYMGGMNTKINEGLRTDAKEILCGDIISPRWFPFSIEAKNYNDSPKLHNLLSRGDKDLDEWIEQARKQSTVSQKNWIIIFKITSLRGKEFVCLDKNVFHSKVNSRLTYPKSYIIYEGCIILDYEEFFTKYFNNYLNEE